MESGLMMVFHALIITVILYFIMVYGLKQSSIKAENRSILIGAAILMYMILFGHGMPNKINSDLF